MAHTLSNESLKRAEEYKKQRIMSGTPEVRAANIASTKRAGVEAARRANTPAVKKTQEASSGFKLSESSLARARAYVGNRDKDKNTGAYNAEPTGEQSGYELDLTPYKTYHQPYGAAGGTGKQLTKAYSEHRLQQEAYDIYAEYGGKSYSEIQKAIAQNTGNDYMTQYRNQVLTQIGQQNRTRDDIEREIAEKEAELDLVYGEVDAAQGDSWKMTDIKNRAKIIRGELEKLNAERWMWDQGEIYSAVPGYSDYKKNSAINPENGEWDDPVYRYINNIERDLSIAAENRMAAYEYMTPEEVGIYNYLYNVSGREAAEKYLEYLEFSLSDKRQREVFENAYDFADKNFGTKTAASLASIPAKLLSGAGYLDVLGQRLNRVVTGSDKPINYNRGAQTAYNFAQGAREGAMSGMSDTGKFIYSTVMSMGDSLGVLGISLLTGGSGATMLLGGSAATSTMHEAKANGASDGQALAMGFIAGAAETIMEELPLEKLLNITPASNWVEFIQNSIKQGANEATEEVLTTLVNAAADVLIMGDKNALMRSYEKYLAQGYTPEEAERLAKNEWWLGLAGDAFAGFLSGGMFGAGGTAVKTINQYSDRTERGKGISASEHTLPLLIDHVEKGYTNELTGETMQYSEETKKTAAEIKGDLSEGKKISNAQKGKLAEQVLKDNAEFNEKVLPGILLEAQNREDAAVEQKDEMSSEKNEMSSKEAVPKRNVVQTIRDRLQKRADAKAGANNVDPAAVKILAQEVLNDESTYSKKTRAAAERIINGETVNNADSQALVKGIKADNADFSGYTAEEIIAEASVLAQEEAPQSTGTETTAEIKTAVPQSTAQQTTTEGAMTNDQGTDGTGNEQRSTEGGTTYSDRGRGRFSETYSGNAAPVSAQTGYNSGIEAQSRRASDRYDRIAVLQVETISSAEAGLENGSEDPTIHVAPEEAYDSEMEAVANDARKIGLTVKYFTGDLTTKNGDSAEAVLIGDTVWIKLDSRFTVSELYDHEKFHYIFRGKPQLIKALAEWITANYSEAEFRKIAREYYKRYKDVYNLGQLTAEEAVAIVTEEILADAYAGTNKFGVEASKYTAAARAGAETMGATSSEYNANQGRAPPQGMTYDDVKQAVREVMSEVMGIEGNKNTAEDGGEKFAVNGKNKKSKQTATSPLTRRSGNQRSFSSTHSMMSSTAAAELLGIKNISNLSDDVKNAITVIAEIYKTVDSRSPALGMKAHTWASNLEGVLIAEGVLKRGGTSGSAYRYDNGHGLRVSDHSAHADNFTSANENLSIALFKSGARNDFVEGQTDVIEAVFRRKYLDNNAKAYKALLHDIAQFIATGEYHDTAGAMEYNYSGSEQFKSEAAKRMEQDKANRERSEQKFAISDEYDVAPEYRTAEDAEDENINTYAYDHPEVKQYYRRVAKDLLVDLTRVTSYEAESGWYRDNTLGNTDTTEAITNLLEDAGMPYREIRSALEAYTNTDPIPEDLKADENLKFLEIEMDRLLREGYSTVFGNKRVVNKRYIEAVEEAQNTELYDDMQFADEDFSQENEEEYTDVYPDEDVYTEDADQAYIERRERERAEELAAEEEAQREALQKRYEADSFFYAANQDEMSRAEETAREIIEEVRRDAVNEGFAVDEAQLKSIEEQTVEIESNNLRQSTLAWLIEEDEDIPDGVSERELQAAVDKKIQTDAELKEIADEPMTFEESVAALEAKSDEEAESYLDSTKKKNFKGTEAMEALPLPIKIAKSVTNYETTPELMKRAVSNGFIIRNMDRKINAMKPTATERKYARMVLSGSELASIPAFINKERILDLVGYMMTKRAARNDTLAAQKSDIKKKYRALAVEQFKGMEKAKRVRLRQLNYMTPRRAMMELFGEEQGQKIYKEVFEPIRQNDAERTRFTQTMKSAAKNFVGSDGKSAMLTKEESALTQMLMEGVAAQELVAKMETETREIVEERAREILKERQEKTKRKKENEENAEEENTEEATDYKDPNERAAQLYSVYLEVQEALNSGKYNNKKIDPLRINNAAEHFTEQYNLLYNAINEFRVAHGDQPIGFIKGYAPHMQSNNVLTPFERMYQWMAATSDIGDLPAEIAGRTHTFRPNSVYNRHFLPRGYESETEYNVYKGFEEYVEKVSQMFYHMDDIMRLRETSQYLRKYYVTEEGRVLLNGLNAVLDKSYDEKLEFLEDAKQISEGERLSAERVEEALENYAEKLFEKYKDSKAVNGAVVVWLDNYTNLLVEKQNAIDRGLEALIDRGGIKLVNSIINKAVSRSVVGNLSSVFSQTAQLPAIIAELGVGNTLEALRDFATRRNELSRFRYENDFLVTRKGTEMLDYATSDKIVNAMAKPLEMADFAISTLAARAAYYQGLRQGMDADAAMEYSVQKAENIMGSRNVASKPVGFSSKHPAMRLLNAFQIEAKNFVQHYSKDLPKEYKELVRKKGKMAAIKKIGGLYLLYAILAFLYNRGMEELTGKTPAQLDLIGIGLNFVASGKGLTVNDYIGQMINRNNENVFETELPEEFDWAGAVKSTGQMAIDEIPLLSNALSIAGFGDDQNIATSAIANAWDYFKLAVDDIVVTREEKENDDETDDESDVLNGVINFAKTGLQFVPGGNQAQKWIEGIMTLTGHGYKNKNGELVYPVRGTAWEWLQTMVIGKSALENAREYYASGASPLRSTRNEQYFAMAENGVDEEEAYRSAQIINDIEYDKDENGKTISGSQMLNRMEYVMETDYPDEVKNLLAMSIATDAAHDRYVDNGLESKGVEAAAYVIAYAYHAGLKGTKENPMSADDKKNVVAEYLREQGVSANEISIILKYLD